MLLAEPAVTIVFGCTTKRITTLPRSPTSLAISVTLEPSVVYRLPNLNRSASAPRASIFGKTIM